MNETRYPLCWPANWKRTPAANRSRAQFGRTEQRFQNGVASHSAKQRLSIAGAINRIADEIRRMGINENNVVISTNVQLNLSGVPRSDRGEPSDPGVAIYWKHKEKQQCMAIDRYDRVADNLAAVAATLEALRAVERHGGGSILERAFIGFAQLQAAIVAKRPWREVFSVGPNDHLNADAVNTRFRALAIRLHSDQGGTHEQMVELNSARAEALAEVGR